MRLGPALLALCALSMAPLARANAPAASGGPARERAWTLSAGTGGGSLFEFGDAFGTDLAAGLTGARSERSGRLQLDLRADRELGPRLRAGATYAHLRWTRRWWSPSGASLGAADSSFDVLLADVTVRWIRAPRLELTSGLGLGGAIAREGGTLGGERASRSRSGVAFQLRLAGLSVGTERFRVWGELGVGFEALVAGGVAVRL